MNVMAVMVCIDAGEQQPVVCMLLPFDAKNVPNAEG
jgi:hypothetical protein